MSALAPALLAIAVAMIGSGVAIYLARSNKDSIIAGAAEKAVGVVTMSLDRQERDNEQLRGRVTVLEAELKEAIHIVRECRLRIVHLNEAVVRLGGVVDDGGDVEDAGDSDRA